MGKTKITECAAEHSFYVSDGSVYKNIAELAKGLKQMKKETFAHHCNKEKNDFQNWVRDVFGLGSLAEKLSTIKSKDVMARIVSQQIKK